MSGATLTAGQDRDRSAIGDKYKWNLTDLYPDLAAWRAAKEATARELPRLRTVPGQAGIVGAAALRRPRGDVTAG